jgi:hypothetical protein
MGLGYLALPDDNSRGLMLILPICSEDKENMVCGMGLGCLASPDDNSRGSLSSSPKHLLSSTVMSPHPDISPVDKYGLDANNLNTLTTVSAQGTIQLYSTST